MGNNLHWMHFVWFSTFKFNEYQSGEFLRCRETQGFGPQDLLFEAASGLPLHGWGRGLDEAQDISSVAPAVYGSVFFGGEIWH